MTQLEPVPGADRKCGFCDEPLHFGSCSQMIEAREKAAGEGRGRPVPILRSGQMPPGETGSPSGHSRAEPEEVSALRASVPNVAWRTDSPPFGQRPIWQYVWVQGERYHSGTTWFRQGWGTAAIRTNDAEDSYMGYRRSDIERICRDNDMELSCAVVVGWLPMTPPALLREVELRPLAPSDDGEYAASAIEARRAATAQTGAVHESAVPKGDAP